MLEGGQDSGERGFISKRHAHPRANTDALGQRFRNGIIELALNGAIDNDPYVIWLHHLTGGQFN